MISSLATKSPSSFMKLSSYLVAMMVVAATSGHTLSQQQHQAVYGNGRRETMLAARRAADDSRPLVRVASSHLNQAASQESPVVVGKFRAPAPERIQKHKLARSNNFGAQQMSASFRVAEDDSDSADKVVHGVVNGPSARSNANKSNQQTVGARIQVSDEGLNYPPSKLSADIYGNVAEIVTAPPEAVDNEFLVPQSSKYFGNRRTGN